MSLMNIYSLYDNHRQLDSVCGRISQFLDFPQDIRALPGADRGTEPFGEIRGCIHEQLSHSDVGPKMAYKSKSCEKPLQQNF